DRSTAPVTPPFSADDRMKVGRVIRTANEWTGSDVLKTFRARDLAISLEAFGRDKFNDREMLGSGPQILAHRQDLAADFPQVIHRLKKFRLLFAEAEHDSTFR